MRNYILYCNHLNDSVSYRSNLQVSCYRNEINRLDMISNAFQVCLTLPRAPLNMAIFSSLKHFQTLEVFYD